MKKKDHEAAFDGAEWGVKWRWRVREEAPTSCLKLRTTCYRKVLGWSMKMNRRIGSIKNDY